MTAENQPLPRTLPSRDAIVRAVASSTAIETGQHIAEIEARLRDKMAVLPHLTLARAHAAPSGRR